MKPSSRGLKESIARALLVASALWSVAIGIWIAAAPLTISETLAVSENGGGADFGTSLHTVSFYSIQGVWGILILVLFAALYSSAAILYGRRHEGWTITTGLLAIILTYLAGFSIGLAYLPAAVTTVAALILIVTSRILRNNN